MNGHGEKRTGRGLAYIRKSKDEAGLGPQSQLEWAVDEARRRGVRLDVSLQTIDKMVYEGLHEQGDLYLDHGVSGSSLSRPGFDAMQKRATTDPEVTHIFIFVRDRFARPENAVDAMKHEA